MTEREDTVSLRLVQQKQRLLNIIAAYTGETHDQIIKRLLLPEVTQLPQEGISLQPTDKENK